MNPKPVLSVPLRQQLSLSLAAILLTSCSSSPIALPNLIPHSDPTPVATSPVIANSEFRYPAAVSDKRGSPSEYDAGPPKDSQWPDIFAETPNYRAYGKAIYKQAAESAQIKDDGQEKFRWKVGPMWYRGRLTPNSVKVFVIGQEGAQDENVSNRTFTGSTGTKMQNFINYFGVDRSYLFMNTFIYTITGQYGERATPCKADQKSTREVPCDSPEDVKQKEVRSNALTWLAQDKDSVVVKHRHRMFDYMLSQNKETVKLIIGVGSAGKDTLATWIRSHGGQCTSSQLGRSYCDASMIAPGAKAIGVMHPGAASGRNGGADAANSLRGQFAERAATVAKWIQANPNWMPADPGMKQDFTKGYNYKDAAIPYRDFAFGTNWRMGKDGTTTNRRGADGIQIFSDAGCYNNALVIKGKCDFAAKPKTLPVLYDEPKDIYSEVKMAPGDLPWESPKSVEGRRQYDSGPGAFSALFTGEAAGGWPDFMSVGVTQHSSFGYGPIYRGNLSNPEVLILADQESNDDLFSTRALTGTGGQQLQNYLRSVGVTNNYLIVRTLPVDTLDLASAKVQEIAAHPQVVKVRSSILDAILKLGKTKLVLTVGPVAKQVMDQYNPAGVSRVAINSPLEIKFIENWISEAGEIAKVLGVKVVGKFKGELTAIPRSDLPSHTRWWMGTSGSRSARAYVKQGKVNVWNGDYYKFDAPSWVSERKYPAKPEELSQKIESVDPNDYQTSLQIFTKSRLQTSPQPSPGSSE